MAKRGTLEHPKNRRLARALKTNPGTTLGLLETIWHRASQFHSNGTMSKLDLDDAFDAGGWLANYTSDELIKALTKEEHCWLDLLPDGNFYIHDWHLHCDDTNHAKLYRTLTTFGNGRKPLPRKVSKAEQESLETEWRNLAAETPLAGGIRQPNASRLAESGSLPCPSLPFLALPSPPLPASGEGVCDFPEEVRRKAEVVYASYGKRRWGKLWRGDTANEQAQRDLRELCGRLHAFSDAESKLIAYFANPPPGRMPTEKLWHIFRHLGLELKHDKHKPPERPSQVYKNVTAERLAATIGVTE